MRDPDDRPTHREERQDDPAVRLRDGPCGTRPIVLHSERLRRRFGDRAVLRLPDLELEEGRHAVLTGASGSGKSTLLHLIAGLLTPSAGRIRVAGRWLDEMRPVELDRFRGRTIGLVLQRLHLVGALTVAGNLDLARWLAGRPQDTIGIRSLLQSLSIAHLADARPDALSQGEAQRVAIARALVNRPQLILADEPTSALDDENAGAVVDLLLERADASGATLLVATHDARIVERFDRRIHLERS